MGTQRIWQWHRCACWFSVAKWFKIKERKTFTSPTMLGKRLTIMITQYNINRLLHTRCWGAGKGGVFCVLHARLQSTLSCRTCRSIFWAFLPRVSNWWGIVSVFETLERLCGFQNVTTAYMYKALSRKWTLDFFNRGNVDKPVRWTPAGELFSTSFFLVSSGHRLARRSTSGSWTEKGLGGGGRSLTVQSEPTLGYFWIGN